MNDDASTVPTVLVLPTAVDVCEGPRGLRLCGPPDEIEVAAQQLGRLATLPDGAVVAVRDWTLVVSDQIPSTLPVRTVSLPADAWGIAASVFLDVVYGRYDSPLDLSDVGYLTPPPATDIGVELT